MSLGEKKEQHMTTWQPRLSRPWSEADLERLLEQALEVLAQTGIRAEHPTLRERLGDWGGVRFQGERILFNPEQVRDIWTMQRATNLDRPPASDRFTLGGCWAGLTYCDPETLEIRPATKDEVIQMVRLWDARGIHGVVPVQPGDVPPAMVTLAAERIALIHSRHLGGQLPVMDPEEVRYLIAMNAVAGRTYTLMEEVAISPLRFNDKGFATALAFRDDSDAEVWLTGAIPMAGVTCPLDPRAAVIQATAERLALNVVCELFGFPASLGVRVEPFDFQYDMIVFGSPEWCLYRTLALQMSEFLSGRPVRGAKFRSTAKHPDAQAACERTASALWQALQGGRHFGGVGQLSVDEVFSPQQAVLDREILAYVARVARGLEPDDALDATALIAEGTHEGNFIATWDTTSHYREVYDFPELFRHWNLNRWRAEGAPALLDEAWAQAQEEIAQADYRLPDDQIAAIDRIYKRATQYMLREQV
jgi:trimethylamine:corrinoid methyltransferase-like protein